MNIVRICATVALSAAAGGCLVPQMAMSPRERGDSFLSHGHYDAAIYHYTRAIERNPDDWAAYGYRAQAHSRKLDLDDPAGGKAGSNIPAALADYDTAIALQPNMPQLYLNRAVVRAIGGQLDGALSDVDQAIRLNPSDGFSYGYRGLVLLRMGRDADAQAQFDRCTQLQPSSRREIDGYIKRIKAIRGADHG